MAPSNQVFSAFSFISFVLMIIPFAWHLQAWNTGTCIHMGWVSLTLLLFFINSVVWNDNVINWVPIYCDIATKILVGASVSVPAAALCINRRLYHIVSVKSVRRTVSEKRRGVFVDLAIGVGIPMIVMILHVVVQGHRFDIYEDIGCWPSIYNTTLTYPLILAPTLALSIIAFIYSILCLISLKRNYVQFKKLLSSNGTNQSSANRYIRLMCLAGLEAFFDIPYNVYVIVTSAMQQGGVQPWISWSDTHFDFNRFDTYPSILWRADSAAAIDLERTRWSFVALGFIFFAFFGFADEAIKNYKLAYNFFARRLGLRLAHVPGSSSSPPTTSQPGTGFSSTGSGVSFLARKKNKGGEKGGGVVALKTNGTESWMGSFDVFASRFKLVVLQSPRKSSFNGDGQDPSMQRSEMVQRRDWDTHSHQTSVFTQLTEFTCTTPSFVIEGDEDSMRSSSVALRRRSSYANQGSDDAYVDTNEDGLKHDEHSSQIDTISQYSQPSPYLPSMITTSSIPLKSPLPPPVPPKDLVYSSAASLPTSILTVPNSALRIPAHGYRDNERDFIPSPSSSSSTPYYSPTSTLENRIPPRQTVPISVSISPTPNGSFLDLTSGVDRQTVPVSPTPNGSFLDLGTSGSADNRV